ncbi:hypothetical protein Arub01_52110 [Actinomadura rubrobrunea]|uniref:Uncharacterized protein n=1 Tax=Actinomadura rubrobrunea TaxID=115335 RepID=A0A9W6Q1Y7_9ACTN|nr:hypothetical protein [Actinomadura rubrobrunea]GLW66968.1 hypothetical protein Arub01_52110 [Actinomadura rubrobrunea]
MVAVALVALTLDAVQAAVAAAGDPRYVARADSTAAALVALLSAAWVGPGPIPTRLNKPVSRFSCGVLLVGDMP